MKKFLVLFLTITTLTKVKAQSLLENLEENTPVITNSYTTSIFKGYKLINFETPKLLAKNHLNLIISHRFGTIKNGISDLYGLDFASTRIQFTYGLSENINISFSRSKFEKTYDFGTKYKIINQQQNGFPFTMAGHHLLAINTQLEEQRDLLPNLKNKNKLRSSHQLLIASKINHKLSIEIIPTLLHDGLVTYSDQNNWQYAVGMGSRYLITKRTGIIIDYGLHLNRSKSSTAVFNNPFSLGLEIETGGHVFQLHFSNAQGMFENAFINQASGDWSNGDIFFGFNINRIFNLKKNN